MERYLNYIKFKNGGGFLSPSPWLVPSLTMSSHKTLNIKQLLAKKTKGKVTYSPSKYWK